jgi:hypothetical protein
MQCSRSIHCLTCSDLLLSLSALGSNVPHHVSVGSHSPGTHRVSVTVFGRHVPNSPFTVVVVDPARYAILYPYSVLYSCSVKKILYSLYASSQSGKGGTAPAPHDLNCRRRGQVLYTLYTIRHTLYTIHYTLIHSYIILSSHTPYQCVGDRLQRARAAGHRTY